MSNKKTKLTAKQHIFVMAYLESFNASKAALAAGYSENCAKEQGYRLLTKDHIKDAVSRELNEIHNQQKRILIRAADSAITSLINIVQNDKSGEAAKVSAANSILDRSGHKGSELVKNLNIDVASIPDDELDKILNR
jgi:phage terminase small subunit